MLIVYYHVKSYSFEVLPFVEEKEVDKIDNRL